MADPAILNLVEDDDGATLLLHYRDEAGRPRVARRPAEHVTYLRAADLDDDYVRRTAASAAVKALRREGPWLRVAWRDQWVRKTMCFERDSPFVRNGVEVYEGDVPPVRRYLTDHAVVIGKPRRAYLDIETDPRVPMARKTEARILLWTLIDQDTGAAHSCVLQADTDEAERALLNEMWDALEAYDQVVAWNGDKFDFAMCWARSEVVGCTRDVRRLLYLDHMVLFERMNKNASESGAEKQSMALNAIAMTILGRGKKSYNVANTWDDWAAGGERRRALVQYNVEDARLMRDIEAETGYIELFQAVCEACRVLPDTHGLNPTEQVEGFLLRLGLEREFHFPTKRFVSKEKADDQYEGAFVMREHECHGIERDVHVADFSALYPSIILTWNMSPETRVRRKPQGDVPAGHCRAPKTGMLFRTDLEGMLPFALREMLRLRKYWNDLKASLPPGTPEWTSADRRSMAYKVAANSFYGVVGSPFSRYFDRDVAESVSTTGAWLIEHTIGEARKRGWHVVYADTDSLFTKGVDRDTFDAFVGWCNAELYPTIVPPQGCVENAIKLAYEKAFSRMVMVTAKRYVGQYSHYKWKSTCAHCVTAKGSPGSVDLRKMRCTDCGHAYDVPPPHTGKPEIRGLEYKRGDVALLTRTMQEDLINRLMRDACEDVEVYQGVLAKVRDHILEDPLPLEEVQVTKKLTKPLGEYVVKTKADGTDAAGAPHVAVARVLKARGRDVSKGTRIAYVVVDGAASPKKVIPAEDYTGAEVDRYDLWEDLVYPAAFRLLAAAFPDTDWTTWERVRPAKPRNKDKVLPGQVALGDWAAPAPPKLPLQRAQEAAPAAPAPPPPTPPAPVRMMRRRGDYAVHVHAADQPDLAGIRAALAAHPGTQRAVLVIALEDGSEAVLDTPYRVGACAGLLEALGPHVGRRGGTQLLVDGGRRPGAA